MGIFKRLSDLLKANVNDLIDKAENPEKMVKQLINDLQSEVAKSTQALGKAKASERMTQRQYENAVADSKDWENKAKAALSQGKEDMAKEALANKVKADERAETYKRMWDEVAAQTTSIEGQVMTLKEKLDEAKSREALLIARSQMADTKKTLAKATGGIDVDSTFDKFNRMEEKIARKEAEADAFAEIAGSAEGSRKDSFEELEAQSKVDAELEKLKNELNSTAE